MLPTMQHDMTTLITCEQAIILNKFYCIASIIHTGQLANTYSIMILFGLSHNAMHSSTVGMYLYVCYFCPQIVANYGELASTLHSYNA